MDPPLIDPWFLAGCLRAPANARRAGTHASSSSRIDIRRLQVLRPPLTEQRLYGEVSRRLSAFERSLREAGAVGRKLMGRPVRRGVHRKAAPRTAMTGARPPGPLPPPLPRPVKAALP
ncbi:hypothetical protein GCM10017673_21390 [Streptosporangium violaceochromogenes]|nr:hypothetical protein GCM10017673_21390 [Streptosporangium violaceochromogenes]